MPKRRRWWTRWRGWGRLFKEAWRRYSADVAALAAAAVAFYMLLSVVPLLLLIISVAAFFTDVAQATAVIERLATGLGVGVGGAVRSLILGTVLSVVENRGVLTGVAIFTGLWVGSQVFIFTEIALNRIVRAKHTRSFLRSRGLAVLMTIITGILVCLALGASFLIHLLDRVSWLQHFSWGLGILVSIGIPLLLIIGVLAGIYHLLPVRRLSWQAVIVGAVLAGVLEIIALQLFSWYAANFANYNVLFGSLGGLVLLMLWFNYSAQIMLFGAEMVEVLDEPARKARHREEEYRIG